jgi:PAS domain S-box-containing protein
MNEVVDDEIATDEVARLQAENRRLSTALADAEMRVALVLEATNDGVWDWDLRSDVAFFSRRWKAILGYAEHEVADRGAAFFELVHEQDRPRVQAAIEGHLQRHALYDIDFRMRTKDGGWRLIQARGQAQWDLDGTPLRMAGVHTDITERNRRELERLHNEELIAIQNATIRTLGVPILQIWKGILCLPIIGGVDDARASDMTSELLDHVARKSTRFAVLDLTGAEFRSETAQHLARMTRALQLIGAQGVFCGISPKTARVLVDMQLDLGEIPTYRDLGDALRACVLRLHDSE